MKLHLALWVLTAAFSTAGQAQSPASGAEAKPDQKQEGKAASDKSRYAADDCRKDMANAREARQAGHITDKEYAEQKKMAQTKVTRDTGQTAGNRTGGMPCE